MTKRGFTLLEVLIVVIIIGILAAIAFPQYTSTIEKARSAEAMNILGTLRSSMERHWFEGVANDNYIDADLAVGATGAIALDVDNPNDNTNRLWNYKIEDANTTTTKSYDIGAQGIGTRNVYWVKIDEDGDITRSTTLGGSGGTF